MILTSKVSTTVWICPLKEPKSSSKHFSTMSSRLHRVRGHHNSSRNLSANAAGVHHVTKSQRLYEQRLSDARDPSLVQSSGEKKEQLALCISLGIKPTLHHPIG